LVGGFGKLGRDGAGQQHKRWRLDRQEGIAEVFYQVAPQSARLSASRNGARDGLERPGNVSFRQGVDELDQRASVILTATCSRQLFEGGLSVPSRAATPADREFDGLWGQTEPSVLVDAAQQVCEQVTVE
jgi:hypothetical protein